MNEVRLPFRDRFAAGEQLAAALVDVELGPDPIVIGIPRGGVPVAAIVADRLGLPLDIIVAHKIGAPFEPELAIGAVASDGTRVVEALAAELLDPVGIERAASEELERARDRERQLRGERPAPKLAGRGVLLVDDGIAIGSTMEAAVRAARAAGAERVVAAVPVASEAGAERIRQVADRLVALATPPWFHAVGQWYEIFDQVTDESVRQALANRALTTA